MAIYDYKEGIPSRQAFYMVQTLDGAEQIGEWREFDKKGGKRWWTYTSADPTVDKVRVPLENVVRYAKVSDAAVASFLKRSLTPAEKIEASYQAFAKQRSMSPEWRRPVPEQRRLTLGQAVAVGTLRNPVVVGVHENGEVVTVEYRSVKRNDTEEIDLGPELSTRYWIEVLPRIDNPIDPINQDTNRATRLMQSYLGTQLGLLVQRMYRDGVSDNPDYQRDYVWTPEDEQLFLDALFNNREIGRFIFVNQYDHAPYQSFLMDGKQRMHTLIKLQAGLIAYKGVYWHEMPWERRHDAMQRVVQFAELDASKFTRAELLQIFLEVNVGGVPQTKEHLAHVQALLEAELAKQDMSN